VETSNCLLISAIKIPYYRLEIQAFLARTGEPIRTCPINLKAHIFHSVPHFLKKHARKLPIPVETYRLIVGLTTAHQAAPAQAPAKTVIAKNQMVLRKIRRPNNPINAPNCNPARILLPISLKLAEPCFVVLSLFLSMLFVGRTTTH
jgi:hypothetical protein